MKSLLSIILVLCSIAAFAVQGNAGPYRVDLKTDPGVIPVGKAKLIITVSEGGKAVPGATVRVLTKMPGMSMGEREETAVPGPEPGTYIAPASFSMAGGYEASITISGPSGTGKAVLNLETGSNTSSGGAGFPLGTVLLWAVVALAAVLVFVQMRRTGQRVNVGGIFNRQVFISLLVLGVALAIAIWAVNSQRREGSMTPMEAQVMEMNTPAPEGVLPVRLAKAELRPFSSTVKYSGQAVGFVEQDVVPRVTGSIVGMYVYVGDRVHKGQVLARLDTSQIDPMVSEKIAGVNTAQQGAGVSVMEYQQALSMVTQARAEVTMAQGELSESQSMLAAAQQGRGSAEAEVESAGSEVEAMQAELNAAQADGNYQQQELQRMKSLFDKGAISKDEWQRAQAEAQKSFAMVDRAKQNVQRARSGVNSARAMLRKTDAEIAAARRKVQQAQANVRAKQAGVGTAEAAARASKGKIGQSQAGVAEAAAGLRGATTQRGYAELRAEVDGVVTARVISPGTVVNPGQSVLKVAQITPIRLQANVPEADLARIQIGTTLRVSKRGAAGEPLLARVTSVSPSVDPTSRTGVVEALYPNKDARFLPGQYLSMDITVSSSENAVVIPSSAIVSEAQTAGRQAYVWLAKPGLNGEFTVERRDVQLGEQGGTLVAVRNGLRAGDQVVVAPPQGIAAGTRVTSSAAPVAAASDQPQVVEITAAGYNPPSISVPANKPLKLTFIRRDDKTCGTEVIFPDLGIRKALPLNQPVEVDIPPQPAGKELNFTCPMNMLKGKAVTR